MKVRNPKAEGRRKSEVRSPKSEDAAGMGSGCTPTARRNPLHLRHFGRLRPSFGLRISGFGFAALLAVLAQPPNLCSAASATLPSDEPIPALAPAAGRDRADVLGATRLCGSSCSAVVVAGRDRGCGLVADEAQAGRSSCRRRCGPSGAGAAAPAGRRRGRVEPDFPGPATLRERGVWAAGRRDDHRRVLPGDRRPGAAGQRTSRRDWATFFGSATSASLLRRAATPALGAAEQALEDSSNRPRRAAPNCARPTRLATAPQPPRAYRGASKA